MTMRVFHLRSLIVSLLPVWLFAWLLGIMTALASVALLMVSGYFIAQVSFFVLLGLVASFEYTVLVGVIRILALVRTFGRYGELLVSHYAIFELLKRLRVQFFTHFALLPTHVRADIGSSLVQHRLIKDIDTLDEFALRLVSPWVIVGGVFLLGFAWYWLIFGWIALALPMVLIVLIGFIWAGHRIAFEDGLSEDRQTELLNALPAITQLSLWSRWSLFCLRLAHVDAAIFRSINQQKRYNQYAQLTVQLILIGFLLLLLYRGVELLALGKLSVALLFANVLGVFGLMELIALISADVLVWAKTSRAKMRLNELVSVPAAPKTQAIPQKFDIVLKSFSVFLPTALYGLKDIHIRIECGIPLVIKGASGAGKSTLLQALAGELAPSTGQMILQSNAQAIDTQSLDWQDEIGYLGQAVDIFDQTLGDNLRLAKPNATDDELWEVLTLVDLKTWAKAQPQQLDTPLGEYGQAVSGGQGRRIALARLLLSPKKVLILDEPFAGLDSDSRERLWQVLKDRQKEGHLIVVSHHSLQGNFQLLEVDKYRHLQA